jgi:hypothetical protein
MAGSTGFEPATSGLTVLVVDREDHAYFRNFVLLQSATDVTASDGELEAVARRE